MSLIYTAPPAGGTSSRSGHGLYIGGKKEAKSRSTLERWGITHILNVTPEKDSSIQAGVANFFEKSGGGSKLVYRRVPVYDTATSDLLSQADGIVGFISSGLHHGSVLVHCKEGVSRSTTCVIFFLMRKLGMTYADAIEMCQRKRPEAQPIPAFVEQCQKYERKCRKLGVIKSGGGGGSGSSSPKKRKLGPSIGPAIGPSIGPEPPAAGGGGANSSGNRHPAPAIGPVVGPAEASDEAKVVGPDNEDFGVGQKDETDDDRKRQSKKAKTVGPAPPAGAS